jgi:hypothetical protein
MTATDAGAAAIRDLLTGETDLRALAEQTARELRGALKTAAYIFAGHELEAEIRKRPVDHWTGAEWTAFFQQAAPSGAAWGNPKLLAEQLGQANAKLAEALAENARLHDELAQRPPATPAPTPVTTPAPFATTPEPAPSAPTRGRAPFSWPKLPDKPPARFAKKFRNWKREGLALALVAAGYAMRLEACEFVGQRLGVKPTSGSMKRLFEKLVRNGLLHSEVLRPGGIGAMFLTLTDAGREVCELCKIPVVESGYERMLRLHGGDDQKEHAAATVIFAYQARRRGWRTDVLPEIEGPAEPDAVVWHDGQEEHVYVEVELGREKASKWKNIHNLQGFVALCAINAAAQGALVREIKQQNIPGRATSIESLIRGTDEEGQLWTEEWQ